MTAKSNQSETAKSSHNHVDNHCVFCERIKNGEYDERYAEHVWFEPLNPVTPGHMLVVPVDHAANINEYQNVKQTGWALRFFTNDLDDYNIITSKGSNATQTIQHLHFHIVPRHRGDGLLLPWTNQHRVTDMELDQPKHEVSGQHKSASKSTKDKAKESD